MRLNEVYGILDTVAPKSLSDEYCARYGAYDNSGILLDTGDEIKGVLFSLDLTKTAIDKALQTGANLLVTHHPAIYSKIADIKASDYLGEKIVLCLKNGISVIAMHLNLDCADGGVDACLTVGVSESAGGQQPVCAVMHTLSLGGYGRAYDLPSITLGNLAKNMEKTFSTSRVLVYGDEKKEVKRAASFCGAGADEDAIAFAIAQGADVVVSSDFKHHILQLAVEKGLGVIVLTHYASETYGFEKYYQKIRSSISLPCVYHVDEIML
ncbi:MAG: Nif3-like dinuclear metal center hexameric protein [Clostridiales bacterium]|nr:Nif3-like dinuclear metal center hexameric protein [Clostridiales bacterium]